MVTRVNVAELRYRGPPVYMGASAILKPIHGTKNITVTADTSKHSELRTSSSYVTPTKEEGKLSLCFN